MPLRFASTLTVTRLFALDLLSLVEANKVERLLLMDVLRVFGIEIVHLVAPLAHIPTAIIFLGAVYLEQAVGDHVYGNTGLVELRRVIRGGLHNSY